MTKEDLIRKLTSRKFWVALIAFVTALMTAFKVPEGSASQVAAVIMSFGSLISYILAEGAVDKSWSDSIEIIDPVEDIKGDD